MTRRRHNLGIDPRQLSLLSPKEEYIMTHDSCGVRNDMLRYSEAERKKRSVFNLHLLRGMTLSAHYGFPMVEPYNGTMNFEMVSYADRKSKTTATKAIHFFMDDHKFIRPVWYKLEATTRKLVEYEVIFAPDFSEFVDAPKVQNLYNIYMSRFVAAYWQKCGFSVIPTASWGNVDSFEYCFESLPENSVIGVCGIGHAHRKGADKLWNMALHELERQKLPTAIIVYGGKKPDEADFKAEIVHFEDYITTHLRKI